MRLAKRYGLPMLLSAALLVPSAVRPALAADDELADTLFLSVTALEHQMLEPVNRRIPPELRVNAKCIAVFPSVLKAGLIVAAQSGNGLVACRDPATREWNRPAVFSLSAASIGLQGGIQSASYLLLFLGANAVETLLREEVTFGNDVSIAAGPVGAAAHHLQPDIVSYVSTQGLFAGIDLTGSTITFVDSSNRELYGKPVGAKDLLGAPGEVPAPLELFHRTLQRFAPHS
jgi:lipid-binding SYLF domain-containing protein